MMAKPPVTDDPRSLLQHGMTLHQSGRLAEAEAACDEVLRTRPDDFDALHLLGVIALQTGRSAMGVDLIGRAIAINGQIAAPHNNLGNGLLALHRYAEAIACYDKAIALGTAFAPTWHSRANALSALHRYEAAIASHERAIALQPDHAEAFYSRGNALRSLRRDTDAVASYDQALTLQPAHADAWYNRGNALRDLGRFQEAAASYARAIELRPDDARAHHNLSNVLLDLRRFADALAVCDTALSLQPDHAETWRNRGNALWALDRPLEAVANYDRSIALRPDHADTHGNRAVAMYDLGRLDEAIAGYARAIALQPDTPAFYGGQSLCHLALGHYELGWRLLEWRWKSDLAPSIPDLPGTAWLGDSPIDGRTILVLAEQGFGDTLQFCRYLPMLAGRARVVLHVPRPLQRLMATLQGVSHIVSDNEPLPPFDAWIPMMSLPLAFGTTLATVPAKVPYLSADPQRTDDWKRRLDALPGRKIGLVWAGSARPWSPFASAVDRRRSMNLRQFAPLAAIPGVCLISLQKGEAAGQLPPEGMTLHDWTAELDDFAATAALVQALDLVISVDTSVVHLAGALNRPVWVLNRYDQCWRWLRDRADSPWYPSARLFCQPGPGDWAGVIGAVVAALRAD